MKRPWLIRAAPLRVRTFLYYRVYRRNRAPWKALYADAPLYFSPRNHMDLLWTDDGHSNIAFTGFYERQLTEQIVQLAKGGGLMVDVGANYGYFSLLWTGAHPGNRVLAFEASPRNYPALVRNIAKNGLESQIQPEALALGKSSGTLQFSLGPAEESGWGGFTLGGEGQAVDVPVKTLAERVPPHASIRVLKIDVEGADTWVLQGADSLLNDKRIEHIFFELNKGRMRMLGIPYDEPLNYLRSKGYQLAIMDGADSSLIEYHAWI
jgi:FkbM family methyltransferase